MTSWQCAGCECEYNYMDPDESHGPKLCPMCADDPEKIKKAKGKQKLGGGVCFLLGVLVGMIVMRCIL